MTEKRSKTIKNGQKGAKKHGKCAKNGQKPSKNEWN